MEQLIYTENDFIEAGISEENETNEETLEEFNFEVLHPENPLMIRFQKALKKVLEKKLEKVQGEISEIRYEIKKAKAEYKKKSELVYDQKQELEKQQANIDKCAEKLEETIANREQFTEKLKNAKEVFAKENATLKEKQKLNTELQNKVESESFLLQQLRQFHEKQSAALAVLHRSMCRAKEDQKQELKEKEKNDYILLKLESAIFNIQLEISTYKKEIESANEEKALLEESVAEQEKEYNRIVNDNKRLLDVWKKLVFLISKKDEEYATARTEFEKMKTSHKEKELELRSYKIDMEQEIVKNEELTATQNGKQSKLDSLLKECSELREKKQTLEEETSKLENMIECTESDLKNSKEAEEDSKRELDVLENQIQKLKCEKQKLEESLLEDLREEMVNNNEMSKIHEEINESRRENEKFENKIKELEENYTNSLKTLTETKNETNTAEMSMQKKKSEMEQNEKKSLQLEEQLVKLKLDVKAKEAALEETKKELTALEENPMPSAIQQEYERLEISIEEIENEIKEEKRAWMRKQAEISQLIEKRSELMENLNNMEKNVDKLEKEIRLSEENKNKREEEGTDYEKSMTQLFHRISKLDGQCYDMRQKENILSNEAYVKQIETVATLKDSEKELNEMQEDIQKLENQKEELEKELLETQRKSLEWEKKVKLATEMKKYIAQQHSENGEIGMMKKEIHRMEIRCAQLKKAQNSLVSDLEATVVKRDDILDKTMYKERTKDDIAKEEEVYKRKIRLLDDKNKKVEKEIEEYDKQISILTEENAQLTEEVKKRETENECLLSSTEELEANIEELALIKHKKLEALVRKQRFADYLSKKKAGKIKPTTRNQMSIEREYIKQQNLNADLRSFLEDLREEFPKLRYEITKILNTAQARSSEL